MPKHVKPTAEELKKDLEKTIEDLETSPSPSKPIPSVSPSPSPEIPSPSPSPEIPSPSKPIPSPEYKEKFINSSREAQILHAKNRKMNEAIDEASKIGDPSDEEMIRDFPDWDVMSDTERKLAKRQIVNDRKFEILHKVSQEGKDIEKWNEDVDKFIEDPKTLTNNPKLEGKIEDFKAFASKPTRRGVSFEDLVSAFLYNMEQTPKPKNKGKMFEQPGGGNKTPIKIKDKISLAEANQLMKTDYRKYKQLLLAGKIDNSELQ